MTILALPLLAVVVAGSVPGVDLPGPIPAAALPAPLLDAALEPVRRSGAVAFQPRPAPFTLSVDGVPVPHDVLAVTVLPGDAVTLEAEGAPEMAEAAFELRYARGRASTEAEGKWLWRAPATPGIVPLSVVGPTGRAVRLNVLVAHPATAVRDGSLNGFLIGAYRQRPLRGDPAYRPPVGFVEVAPGDEDVLVSPHFTLGEFLCKQPGLPRFLALSTPLVLKLEAVLEAANARGLHAPGLTVMSGFRTPWYNRAIGNTTDYSRHLWGDAADVYVDADGDGDMDDLNGDGRVDLGDARVLASVVDEVERSGEAIEPGGVGLYRRNSAHGPFVHVDARGTPARW